MDEGKIFIANLSKGKIGEDNARLLGSMLMTKVYLAAMSRVDIPEEERRDFFFYVDEFQNFQSKAFADVLSEARKYRLSLVLAHQYITQMDEEVRDAVLGNVGTLISFRVGAMDAESLEKEFAPEFAVEDFVNLGKYNIILKLMIDGLASRGFSAVTLRQASDARGITILPNIRGILMCTPHRTRNDITVMVINTAAKKQRYHLNQTGLARYIVKSAERNMFPGRGM